MSVFPLVHTNLPLRNIGTGTAKARVLAASIAYLSALILLPACLAAMAGDDVVELALPGPSLGIVPGQRSVDTTDDQVLADPGLLRLQIAAPAARRAWLYYLPDAGEPRQYFISGLPDPVYFWRVEPASGGSLYVVSESREGGIRYSNALQIRSRSYDAVRNVVQPDPAVRVEVNLPAFELSVYRNNDLLKRFRVGIGVKSWPVPTGLRTAQSVEWNPEWAPPNSPWATPALVRQLKARGEVLGRLKISLGGEILIHGTSRRSDLGRLVSHGCLRMHNRDIQQLARLLIAETGATSDPKRIKRAELNRRYSYHVPLPRPVLVSIAYHPVVVREGKVIVHKDVYGIAPVTPAMVATARAAAGPVAEEPSPRLASQKPHPGRAKVTPTATRR